MEPCLLARKPSTLTLEEFPHHSPCSPEKHDKLTTVSDDTIKMDLLCRRRKSQEIETEMTYSESCLLFPPHPNLRNTAERLDSL